MKTLTILKMAVIFVLLVMLNSAVYSQNSNGKPIKNPLQTNQGTGNFVLNKHTISVGGGEISGMNYVVVGSIGQIDAGHITTAGGYQFIGGILAAPRNNELFKNGFE